MPYIGYQQEASSAAVKTADDIIIPKNATSCEVQADTNNVKYTCDGTDPTTTFGMTFLTTEPPKEFLIEDIRSIKFIQNSVGAGNLNFHFIAGRKDLP